MTYIQWIKRFIVFHGKPHPSEIGSDEVNSFLAHLAVQENVAAFAQNQALGVILFLYREVLQQEVQQVDKRVEMVSTAW